MIWKITAYYLKLYRHKYLGDLEAYNKYAWAIVDFYRLYEFDILQNNIEIKSIDYKKRLENLINNL